MNNLQQFLEEEFKDYGVRMSEDEDHFEFESPSPSKILDFTNKVLDEVKREVEELNKLSLCGKCEISTKNELSHTQLCNYKKRISTIISQLKLK